MPAPEPSERTRADTASGLAKPANPAMRPIDRRRAVSPGTTIYSDMQSRRDQLRTGGRSQARSLSPRGTSGERAGERGPKRPPLPDPLLLVGGGGGEAPIRFAQSQLLSKHSSQFECDLELAVMPAPASDGMFARGQ